MQKRIKRITLGLVAVGLCTTLLLTGAIPVCEAGPDERVVKIGLHGAFTGPLASTSARACTAALDYVKYTNEQGGINGIKIEMPWFETRAEVSRAITAHKRLKEIGVVMEMDLLSTICEALAPIMQRDAIPLLYESSITPLMMTYPIRWVFGLTFQQEAWIVSAVLGLKKLLPPVPGDLRVGHIFWDQASG